VVDDNKPPHERAACHFPEPDLLTRLSTGAAAGGACRQLLLR
jgi:hypothetical protein